MSILICTGQFSILYLTLLARVVKWQTHCLQEAALARAWEFKSPLGHKGKLTDVDFCLFFQFSSVVNTRGHHLWKFLFFSTGEKTLVGTYSIKMLSESSEPAKNPPQLSPRGIIRCSIAALTTRPLARSNSPRSKNYILSLAAPIHSPHMRYPAIF